MSLADVEPDPHPPARSVSLLIELHLIPPVVGRFRLRGLVEHPANSSVTSDQNARLNQQPGRPEGPVGHSSTVTEDKHISATTGPPGPSNNLRSTSGATSTSDGGGRRR